ncbi:lysophospholipid acyltransferase family protein [Streptomyces sp. CA-243310]|uniref:lysophospholipid acyltransferase family protein n=1 Tax=Streptomyces sp. CA-243310 TaxID=3240056 RepID=UPI003D8E6A4A
MNAWLPTAPCTPEACAGHEGRTASVPHAVLRLAGAAALVLLAVLTAAPVRLLPARPRHALVRGWSAALVASLGVRTTVHGSPGASGARLIVANHISWLDVPLVSAVLPCRMLAKSEIGAWPVLGRLAARAGTLFIERDRIRALPDTVATLTRALLAGDRVTVFPEGSTWCGRAQGPFRRAAFQSALDAGVPVQPIRLAYRLSGGGQPAGTLAGAPAFVGDDPLTASLWRIARARGVRADVWLLPRIPPGRHEGRRDLAAAAQEAVRARAARPVPAARPAHPAEPAQGARPQRTAPFLPGIPTQPTGSSATDRDSAKRPSESVHHRVNSSPAEASSLRTPS